MLRDHQNVTDPKSGQTHELLLGRDSFLKQIENIQLVSVWSQERLFKVKSSFLSRNVHRYYIINKAGLP